VTVGTRPTASPKIGGSVQSSNVHKRCATCRLSCAESGWRGRTPPRGHQSRRRGARSPALHWPLPPGTTLASLSLFQPAADASQDASHKPQAQRKNCTQRYGSRRFAHHIEAHHVPVERGRLWIALRLLPESTTLRLLRASRARSLHMLANTLRPRSSLVM